MLYEDCTIFYLWHIMRFLLKGLAVDAVVHKQIFHFLIQGIVVKVIILQANKRGQ